MEPISIGLGIIGLGMQIFGGIGQAEAASAQAGISQQESGVSMDEAKQEQGINDLKQQQMEMDARRQQMEIIRQQQRVQALGLSRATNQNAQFGSGIQGGLAQATAQSLTNLQGVNGALEVGRGIAGFNQNITEDKYKMFGLQSISASYGGQAATDQGISSLGGAVLKAGPIIGQFSKGFGSGSSGGNYSGTPGASNTGGLY